MYENCHDYDAEAERKLKERMKRGGGEMKDDIPTFTPVEYSQNERDLERAFDELHQAKARITELEEVYQAGEIVIEAQTKIILDYEEQIHSLATRLEAAELALRSIRDKAGSHTVTMGFEPIDMNGAGFDVIYAIACAYFEKEKNKNET